MNEYLVVVVVKRQAGRNKAFRIKATNRDDAKTKFECRYRSRLKNYEIIGVYEEHENKLNYII